MYELHFAVGLVICRKSGNFGLNKYVQVLMFYGIYVFMNQYFKKVDM